MKLSIHILQLKSFLPPSLVFYPPFFTLKIATLDIPKPIFGKFSFLKKGGKKLVSGIKTFDLESMGSHLSFAPKNSKNLNLKQKIQWKSRDSTCIPLKDTTGLKNVTFCSFFVTFFKNVTFSSLLLSRRVHLGAPGRTTCIEIPSTRSRFRSLPSKKWQKSRLFAIPTPGIGPSLLFDSFYLRRSAA